MSRAMEHWGEVHRAGDIPDKGKSGRVKVGAAGWRPCRAALARLQFILWKEKWLQVCEQEALSTKQHFKINVKASKLLWPLSSSMLNPQCLQVCVTLKFTNGKNEFQRDYVTCPLTYLVKERAQVSILIFIFQPSWKNKLTVISVITVKRLYNSAFFNVFHTISGLILSAAAGDF